MILIQYESNKITLQNYLHALWLLSFSAQVFVKFNIQESLRINEEFTPPITAVAVP